jgi:Flp pilus assembly protein TadD
MTNGNATTHTASSSLSNNVDEQVGQAWTKHYKGDHQAAITAFKTLVGSNPNHIDARFGYALSLKSAGQSAEALEHFSTARELIQKELTNVADENARFRMLLAIVDQHLGQLGAKR